MRRTLYDPLIAASGLSHTEFALTMSVLGLTAFIFYAPGGWMADKFSPRVLLPITFVGTGLLGFYYATFPPYHLQIAIHAIWGCLSTLTFWSALLKATRMLGTSEEQGKLFGMLEGIRGLAMTLLSASAVFIFSLLGESLVGIQGIIVALSALNLISAALVWVVLKNVPTAEHDPAEKHSLDIVFRLLRMPSLWLLSLIIISSYSIFVGASYLTPYFSHMLGASATISGVLAVARTYVFMIFCGPLGGLVATRIGSSTKVTFACFIIMGLALIGLTLSPTDPSALIIVLVLTLVLCLGLYAMRGVYFAIVDEIGIPLAVTGTAVGIVSAIGFIPDFFMNIVAGVFLDAFPGATGYQHLFMLLMVFALIGLLATGILLRIIKRIKNYD